MAPTVVATPRPPAALTQVGFVSLPGYNADVWAYNGFAYVGTTGVRVPTRCPASGVRVVDLADPAYPAVVGAVAAIPRSTQEKVVVRRIDTAAFHGDLLAVGVQACDTPAQDAPRGVDLWDVTNPRQPQHLAFWDSGRGSFRGVHELWLFARGDRAYIAAAIPSSALDGGPGDFRLLDVTDPRQPAQISVWDARRDAGLTLPPGKPDWDHSAYVNAAGTLAILSYTDFGVIFLDIGDPAHPRLVGRATYADDFPWNTHSVALAASETVLLVCDEILDPSAGRWGYLRLWDVRDPAHPVEIAHYATANSLSTRRDGDYSVHNPVVVGTTAFLSWYSDGIRVLDIADPAHPRELASFVPPATGDPYGTFKTAPEVWGVAALGDLVLASDINAGLYVLRYAR